MKNKEITPERARIYAFAYTYARGRYTVPAFPCIKTRKEITDMQELERDLEDYFTRRAQSEGMLTFKFTSPGQAGVPDRILISDGRVLFVELKAPGKRPRPLQTETVRRMRKQGASCYCISTREQVDRLLYNLAEAWDYPNESDYDPL